MTANSADRVPGIDTPADPAGGGPTSPGSNALPVRPVAGIERGLWRIDKISRSNMFFDIAGTFSGQGPTYTQLELALSAMQRRHPLLRVRVATEAGQILFRETVQPIPLRLLEGDPRPETLFGALNRPVDVESGPPVSLDFYVDVRDRRWRALFVWNHMAADGLSALSAIQGFLDALSGPSSSTQSPLVPCTPTTTAPSTELLPKQVRRWTSILRALMRRLVEHVHWSLTGYPRKLSHDRSIPFDKRHTAFCVRELSEAETAALQSCAKKHGTSVHAALCVANLAGIRTHFTGEHPIALSIYSPTNLRSHLKTPAGAPVPSDHLGQFVGYLQCTRRMGARTDLWKTAKSVGAEIRRKTSLCDDLSIHYLSDRFVDWTEHRSSHDYPYLRRQARLAERSIFHSAVVSNLGAVSLSVDERWGTVDRVDIMTCTGPMNVFLCVPLTFTGRLRCSFMWSQPCISPEDGEELADRCVSALRSMISSTSNIQETSHE